MSTNIYMKSIFFPCYVMVLRYNQSLGEEKKLKLLESEKLKTNAITVALESDHFPGKFLLLFISQLSRMASES